MRKRPSSFSLISISARKSRGLDFLPGIPCGVLVPCGVWIEFRLGGMAEAVPFHESLRDWIGPGRLSVYLVRAKACGALLRLDPSTSLRAGSRGARPHVSPGEH
jgi:hypothetical protein